jgi:TonB family protein
MKRVLVFIALLILPALCAVAQQQGNGSDIFGPTEQMPEFQGGSDSLMSFLSRNLKYPESAIKSNLQGMVRVRFIIDESGKVTRCQLFKSTFAVDKKYKKKINALAKKDLEKEALRVVAMMPDWKPGYQKGIAVKVIYTLPVNFQLED